MLKVFECIQEMEKQGIVATALRLGWKPNVADLWSKWLDEITADIKQTERLRSLLEATFPDENTKLRCLIQWGFVSTEAEAFVAGINFIKDL